MFSSEINCHLKIVSFEFVEAYVRIECLNSFYDILRLFIDHTDYLMAHTSATKNEESWAQSFTQLKEYKKYTMSEGHKEYKYEYTKIEPDSMYIRI